MWQYILISAVALVVLPVLAYMIVKFGAAAYFREKNKNNNINNEEDKI